MSNNGDISVDVHGQVLRKLLLSGYWNKSKTVVRFATTRCFFIVEKRSEAFLLNISRDTLDYVASVGPNDKDSHRLDTFYFELVIKHDFSRNTPYLAL